MRRAWLRVLPVLLVAAVITPMAVMAVRASTPPTENPADPATYDPYFSEQWNLVAIKAPQAWTRSTGAGVRIGVIDTGIDLTHEDLAAKIVASISCIGANDVEAACSGSAQDDEGHGTHVAGIAAAITDNGKGVASVAPDAQLVIVKALNSTGSGALNDVNAGIKWAVDHGARVINLSLESDAGQVTVLPGQSLNEGIDYAWQHGAIPVIAAGNSTPSLFGILGYSGVNAVVVGATGRAGELAWYSSSLEGAKWGLVAPGGDSRGPDGQASCAGALASGCIVSTGWFPGKTNQYADDEGTSMATPEVSGVLALLLAQGLSPTAAIDRMLETAVPMSCGPSCHGLLDAAAAVGAPAALPTTTPAATPSTSAPPTTTSPAVVGNSAVVHAPQPATPPSATGHPTAHPGGAAASAGPGAHRHHAAPVALGPGRIVRRRLDPVAVVVAILALLAVGAEVIALDIGHRRVA
jgi:subtilisin family serine protease